MEGWTENDPFPKDEQHYIRMGLFKRVALTESNIFGYIMSALLLKPNILRSIS